MYNLLDQRIMLTIRNKRNSFKCMFTVERIEEDDTEYELCGDNDESFVFEKESLFYNQELNEYYSDDIIINIL